jgi:amino acid transporter
LCWPLGFSHFEPANLAPSFFPFGSAGAFRAVAIVYWSYMGFDMVATMTKETKNPGCDVPLGPHLVHVGYHPRLLRHAPGARGDAAVQRH